MGEIYADLDMHDKAVVAYQTGLELRADWGYYLKMGFALQKLGRFAEAILAFEEARATISDDDIHRILDRAISECRAKQR